MAGGPTPSPWSYTRAQRGGLILLIVLLAGGYGVSRLLRPDAPPDFSGRDAELFAAARQLRAADSGVTADKPTAAVFPFEPNAIGHTDLMRLGLSDKQATAYLRYREKAPFRSAEDIGRLRVLRPDQAQRLMEYATFPAQRTADAPATYERVTAPPQRFPFDPNTLPEDSLRLLGLNEREAKALVKYRSYRAVTFRRPEDLLRVRAVDSQKVAGLLDLVALAPAQEPAPASPPPSVAEKEITPIDINRATEEEWTTLPGIGPYRAGRIVKFREDLGGFTSTEQVATTYGMPDSVYRAIAPYLRPSPPTRPLHINRLDAEELARHPYLKRTTAVIIVRYRQNHGPFRTAEDLKKVRAVSTETLDALLPYLNFDP